MFKVGDEVVCVDVSWHGTGHAPDLDLINIDQVYQVAHCVAGGGVRLLGIPSFNPMGYRAERFRKVQRTRQDLSIERFLTIKPGFEEPKRAPEKQKEKAK